MSEHTIRELRRTRNRRKPAWLVVNPDGIPCAKFPRATEAQAEADRLNREAAK
jgi:hypothetical protein